MHNTSTARRPDCIAWRSAAFKLVTGAQVAAVAPPLRSGYKCFRGCEHLDCMPSNMGPCIGLLCRRRRAQSLVWRCDTKWAAVRWAVRLLDPSQMVLQSADEHAPAGPHPMGVQQRASDRRAGRPGDSKQSLSMLESKVRVLQPSQGWRQQAQIAIVVSQVSLMGDIKAFLFQQPVNIAVQSLLWRSNI